MLPTINLKPTSDSQRQAFDEFTTVDLLANAFQGVGKISDSDQAADAKFQLRVGVSGGGDIEYGLGAGSSLSANKVGSTLTINGTLAEINDFLSGANGSYLRYKDTITTETWNAKEQFPSVTFAMVDSEVGSNSSVFYMSFKDQGGDSFYQDGNKLFAGHGGVAGAPGKLVGTGADEHFFGSVVTTSDYTGDNIFTGGGGNDKFYFDRTKGNGNDVITDFSTGDKLMFIGVDSADAMAANGSATWNDATKTLSFNASVGAATSSVHLEGYVESYASAVDFLRANAEFHQTLPPII